MAICWRYRITAYSSLRHYPVVMHAVVGSTTMLDFSIEFKLLTQPSVVILWRAQDFGIFNVIPATLSSYCYSGASRYDQFLALKFKEAGRIQNCGELIL